LSAAGAQDAEARRALETFAASLERFAALPPKLAAPGGAETGMALAEAVYDLCADICESPEQADVVALRYLKYRQSLLEGGVTGWKDGAFLGKVDARAVGAARSIDAAALAKSPGLAAVRGLSRSKDGWQAEFGRVYDNLRQRPATDLSVPAVDARPVQDAAALPQKTLTTLAPPAPGRKKAKPLSGPQPSGGLSWALNAVLEKSPLPAVRERAGQQTYVEAEGRAVELRAERTQALLLKLLEGSKDKAPLERLVRLYALRSARKDLARRTDGLREWQRETDSFLAGASGIPALDEEKKLRNAFLSSSTEAELALNRFSSTALKDRPELGKSLARMLASPETLSKEEWAVLSEAVSKRRGTPEHEAFLESRQAVLKARSALEAFLRSHPELARYQEDQGTLRAFHWQNLSAGRVFDGKEFTPKELGVLAPEGARLVKATIEGRAGLWTQEGEARRFESFDGGYVVERRRGPDGKLVDVRSWLSAGGVPKVEFRSLEPGSPWVSQTGTYGKDGFVPETTRLADGSSLKRLDALTTELLGKDGRRQGVEFDAGALFSARGAGRSKPADALAASAARALGWQKPQAQALSSWLRDGFAASEKQFESMRLLADQDGTLRAVYRRKDGTARVETARFDSASAFAGKKDAAALVVLAPSELDRQGQGALSPKRWKEYLPDGTLQSWAEVYGTTSPKWWQVWKSEGTKAEVSLRRMSRDASGLWKETGREHKQTLVEDVPGSSTLGKVAEALYEVPVLSHVMKALDWTGEKSTKFVVGGNQYLWGKVFDSARLRVEGIASMEQMAGSDAQRMAAISARVLDPQEKKLLDLRVYGMRAQALKRSGHTPERLGAAAYEALLYRPIDEEERAHALGFGLGAGTYGTRIGEKADEASGWKSWALGAGSVGMHITEGVAQSWPTFALCGGLDASAAVKLPVGASRLAVAAVSTAKVANAVFTPYIIATWGVSIPQGVGDLYEAVQLGDTQRITAASAQVITDTAFLGYTTKEFKSVISAWRTGAAIEHMNQLVNGRLSAPQPVFQPTLPIGVPLPKGARSDEEKP